MKSDVLRKKYPRFFYRGYSYRLENRDLKISFDFEVPPDISFHPQVIVKNAPRHDNIDNLVFHLGLMEIPSYWKATCSPKIIVEAGHLTKQQITWWHDLIMKGMGEYFYKNKIDFTKPGFLKISSTQSLPKPVPKPGLGPRPKPGLGIKGVCQTGPPLLKYGVLFYSRAYGWNNRIRVQHLKKFS